MVVMLVPVLVVVVVMMVMLVLIMVVMVVLRLGLSQQLICQGVAFHGGEDLVAGDLSPVGGDDDGICVLSTKERDGLLQLVLRHIGGAAEDDGAGVLHLIVKELAEVLHIHLGLLGIDHGDGAAQLQLRLLGHTAHRLGHVRQLAHAGGLDDNAVGSVGLQHLLQGNAEVAHQRAADAAGVHLGDLNAGVLHKAAVNADLAEFVFDEHQLLALEGLLNQLFDEGGLAGTQKTGNNVDGCHSHYLYS